MPYLKIQTNAELADSERTALIKQLSNHVAEMLGKSERYVMVVYEFKPHMVFAGSEETTAFIELKSIGLDSTKTQEYSASLCERLNQTLGVAQERIFIEFSDAPRPLWGWNGRTF